VIAPLPLTRGLIKGRRFPFARVSLRSCSLFKRERTEEKRKSPPLNGVKYLATSRDVCFVASRARRPAFAGRMNQLSLKLKPPLLRLASLFSFAIKLKLPSGRTVQGADEQPRSRSLAHAHEETRRRGSLSHVTSAEIADH